MIDDPLNSTSKTNKPAKNQAKISTESESSPATEKIQAIFDKAPNSTLR